MADEKKFSELVSDAPMATTEGTVSLVGALQRSREAGKFVLVLGGGQSLTLDVADVKEHQVLGGMCGQQIVRVEVDADKVPSEAKGLGALPITVYWLDVKNPPSEIPHMTVQEVATAVETAYENIGNPIWVNPYGGVIDPALAVSPFVLTTQPQAPAAAAAAMRVVKAYDHFTGPQDMGGPPGLEGASMTGGRAYGRIDYIMPQT